MAVTSPRTNTLAIVSLALGVGSFFLLPLIGAVAAVITGHLARAEIRRTGEAGGGLALGGLVLGYVHLALAAIAIVIVGTILVLTGGFVLSQLGH